jgi:MYXO-CTERM domain-containing protein
MTRRAAILAALAALAPAAASGQWRSSPMAIPAAGAQVLLGRFSAGAVAAGDEVLAVDRGTGVGTLRAHGALLSTSAWPIVLPGGATPLAAGRTRACAPPCSPPAPDLLADVTYPQGSGFVVRFGAVPGTPILQPITALGAGSFVHALPFGADQVAYPTAAIASGDGGIVVADFQETSPLGGTMESAGWAADGLSTVAGAPHRVFGVPLSRAAVVGEIEDLAVPTAGGVFLLVHRPGSAPPFVYATSPVTLFDLAYAEVRVGGTSAQERPPWLPATVPAKADALGAAAVDLDLDGTPDLLFSYGSITPQAPGQGRLILVAGTLDPLDLGSTAWQDVTSLGGLQPLSDPSILRQVSVGGAPAAAIWDRGRSEIVVAWVEGIAPPTLHVWRGTGATGQVRDIRTADLVGSADPDLVVVSDDAVLVYPDVGGASPALAWMPGSPPEPFSGEDLALSVSAADPDGACTVEWYAGSPDPATLVTVAVVPAGAPRVLSWTMAGALLCASPPQTVAVTVRATDAQGVFDELSFGAEVLSRPPQPPLLSLTAGLEGGRVPLRPGGTSLVVDGSSPARCASGVTFTWGGTLFAAVPTFVEEATATTTRRTVEVAEASYPALLADPSPAVTLVVADGLGASAPATLALALDASGLVEARHEADVPVLGPGEIAVLRTTLESRLGVALPGVRVVDLAAGLVPAGAPRVSGAGVLATARGGADVVLDALPPAGARVVIELPVRSTGEPGRSAVEARSAGGWLLTPPAPAAGGSEALPGCGCASGGGAEGLAALVLLLAGRGRRRRRAT